MSLRKLEPTRRRPSACSTDADSTVPIPLEDASNKVLKNIVRALNNTLWFTGHCILSQILVVSLKKRG
jgi:hypothetical protein